MRIALGQPVVIENYRARPAASRSAVSHARPRRLHADHLGNLGTHVVNGAIYSLPYDLVKDFEPICLLPTNFQLLIAKSGLPAKDFKELISWLKANAGKVTIGTAGPGAPSHLTAVYFQNALGAQFQLIPYRGTPQALSDLIAGQIDLVDPSSALPLVRGGKVKTYGVTALQRLPRRRSFRPCMKADCRISRRRTGSGCGRQRARRPTSSRGSTWRPSPR